MKIDRRGFPVDRIQTAHLLDTKAKDIDDRQMDKIIHSGYGIFSGDHVTWSALRFTRNGRGGWRPSAGIRCRPDKYAKMAAICCAFPTRMTGN